MTGNFISADGIFKHGYGFSPKMVMKDLKLSIEAKAIYAYLSAYSGAGMSSFPSVDLICHELGISRQRYNKHRAKLEELGYLTVSQVKKQGAFGQNVYTLNIVPTLQNITTEDSPTLRNPTTENPTSQNITSNSNNLNSNNINTPPTPKGAGKVKVTAKAKAQQIIDLYNETCGDQLAKAIALNPKRQRQIENVCKIKLSNGKAPFANYNLKAWHAYFDLILENKWNVGENPSNWKASIDYVIRPDTVIKTLERKYA